MIELLKGIHFNPSRIEQLIDQINELNKRLTMLEGKLLRLATNSKIKREDFLEFYREIEKNPGWAALALKRPGKAWKTFVEKYEKDVDAIRESIAALAAETQMPIVEYRRIVNTVKKGEQETNKAKREMIRIPLREGRTLHHDVRGRYGAGEVVLRTAPAGTGIIAGGPMRAVFETMGIQDIVAKSIGSQNPHNMIKATFAALKTVNSPRMIAAKRGKKVGDVVAARDGVNAAAVKE